MIVKAPLPDVADLEKDLVHKRPQRKQMLWPPIFSNTTEMEEPAWYVFLPQYINTAVLLIFGYLRDFLRAFGLEKNHVPTEPGNKGYPPLYGGFTDFYKRNFYRRSNDLFFRPITGVPGGHVDVLERKFENHKWKISLTGKKRRCLNLASYNYLGFANSHGSCADYAIEIIKKYGVATASSQLEMGHYDLLDECEQLVAEFVGKESALIFGMGFMTNSTVIPALVGDGCLILSDELNHSSIVAGAKLSGAKIRIFKHNNLDNLEKLLQTAVRDGQPNGKPWRKIMIIVEGIYSMEGIMVNLTKIVALKKKYKAYLYLDEAHSIGAIGYSGRGVCEYWGVDVRDVDIMMGTFTKSFGSAGGYIAADKLIIDHLRLCSHGSMYAPSSSPPVMAQMLESMRIIAGLTGGDEGIRKIRQLHDNTRYFRQKCMEMGFIIYGSDDSPVIPLLIFNNDKLTAVSREMLARGFAVTAVGFPATSLKTTRVRFCMSASHTREDLVSVLRALDEVGDLLMIKYSRQPHVIGYFRE